MPQHAAAIARPPHVESRHMTLGAEDVHRRFGAQHTSMVEAGGQIRHSTTALKRLDKQIHPRRKADRRQCPPPLRIFQDPTSPDSQTNTLRTQ